MLTPLARFIIGGTIDFVLTGGGVLTGYMILNGAPTMPSAAAWLAAGLFGAMGAAKHLQAMMAAPPK